MISKELLGEVLSPQVTGVEITNKGIWIKYGKYCTMLNIYELAHRCKDFAFTRGYELIESEFCVHIRKKSSNKIFKTYEASEEECNSGLCFTPERVFKACQWILENKDQQ